MAIDLDSFFDGAKSEVDKLSKKKQTNLDFQKEVEEKLHKVQSEAEKGDFDFLKKIYEEVKKFEEDLPNKFLNIEKESNIALKTIGKQYSTEFLNKAKENVSKLSNLITQEITEFDKSIKGNNFVLLLEHFNKALNYYNSFPREFFIERTQIGSQIRKREILMTKKLEKYKQTELKIIKKQVQEDVLKLNSRLKPGEITTIEDLIGRLHYTMSKSPKIFLASLTKEKIIVSETIIKAENFLREEYERVFLEKEKLIETLTQGFHTQLLNNDLQNSLTIYNQIMIEFESVPEVFLERKMLIYSAINDLYGHLNNLIIKNSVSNFLESYNYSKILEEARDYVEHAKITGIYDIKNLVLIKNKLSNIPEKYSSDKTNLEKQIFFILDKSKHIHSTTTNTENSFVSSLKTTENSKLNKKLLEEIEMYYKRLKKTKEINEAKLMFRKINFYLDLVQISKKEKEKLLVKVYNVLKSKEVQK